MMCWYVHLSTQVNVLDTFRDFFWWKSIIRNWNISICIFFKLLFQVGTMACPMMPLVGLASNLVFFMVTYIIVTHTCKPPLKRWNQSRNTSFFSMLLLGSLAILIPPASVIIGRYNSPAHYVFGYRHINVKHSSIMQFQ